MNDQAFLLRDTVARSQALAQAGQPRAAASLLKGLGIATAAAPEVAYLQAILWMQAGDWAEALAMLDGLLLAGVTRAVVVFDRAACLIELGRDAEAERALADESPEVRDRFPRYVLLARLAARAGDAERAEALLRRAEAFDLGASAMAAAVPELAVLAAR